MTNMESLVKVCSTRGEAEGLVQSLQKTGIEMKSLSIVENKFLVVARGAREDMAKARDLLGSLEAESSPQPPAAESGAAPIAEDDA